MAKAAAARRRGAGPRERKARRAIDPRNTLNELSGDKWLYFTKSVLQTSFPREMRHDLRKAHGANKPPALMRQLIEFFTKRDGLVLDPFAGVGGTLLGAASARPARQAVGIEVSAKWAQVYDKVAASLRAQGVTGLDRQRLIVGDCIEEMARLDEGAFDFVVTDPPYNVHLKITMSVGKQGKYKQWANRRTDFDMKSDDPRDLANLGSYDEYLRAMEAAFAGCHRALKPGKYMALIVRDAYQGGRYVMTHADLARRAEAAGFTTKGDIVWWQTGTRLRPYGYPFSYVPNIAHQHIVVFRKQPPRGHRRAGDERRAAGPRAL